MIGSARQQAGRSGRTRGEALSIMIALDNPLDQFLMRHPEYFFGRTSEQAIVNADNHRIIEGHLACAAHELPLDESDVAVFGPSAPRVIAGLEEAGTLLQRNGRWYYRGADHPAGQ